MRKIKKATLASKFKKEKGGRSEEAADESEGEAGSRSAPAPSDGPDETGQLVFFQEPFATEIAKLISDLRSKESSVYSAWSSGKRKKGKKEGKDDEDKRVKTTSKLSKMRYSKKARPSPLTSPCSAE